MAKIDSELRGCAELALRNAFYHRYSALLLAFEQAHEGLENPGNPDYYTDQLQSLSNVYSSDKTVKPDRLPVVTASIKKPPITRCTEVENLAAALANADATDIWLEGKHVFQRRDGEWFYVA